MARLGPVDFEDRLTLVEHLDELRTRIVISIVAFSVAFALCFWQNSTLLDIANKPLPGHLTPITFGVAEPFTTTVTVSAYAAILVALPFVLYQLYAFVLPAFKPQERKVALPVMAVAPMGQSPADAFARLAELSDLLRRDHPEASAISAGMSAVSNSSSTRQLSPVAVTPSRHRSQSAPHPTSSRIWWRSCMRRRCGSTAVPHMCSPCRIR